METFLQLSHQLVCRIPDDGILLVVEAQVFAQYEEVVQNLGDSRTG